MNPKARQAQRNAMQDKDFKNQLANLQQAFMKRMDDILKEPPKWFPSRTLWYAMAKVFLNI